MAPPLPLPSPLPSPLPPTPISASSTSRSKGGAPLLSLAPPALAIAEEIPLGDDGEERSARDIWHAITKASDLVKDGDRLENLVWRLSWGQRRLPRKPSLSSFSVATGSSTSLNTPLHEHSPHDFPPPVKPPSSPCGSSRSERRTFGGALKLLVDDDVSFRDWVGDAKLLRNIPEIYVPSVPDTPVANVEIRLVEPTPVPSRVGSLGGSLGAAGLLGAPAVPRTLREDREGEEAAAEGGDADDEVIEEEDEYDPEGPQGPLAIAKAPKPAAARSPRRKGKFFVHSSPSKGSGSESSHPSPVAPTTVEVPSSANEMATSPLGLIRSERRGSGSSSAGGVVMKSKKSKSRRSSHTANAAAAAVAKAEANGDSSSTAAGPVADPSKEKRHVSLSTMRGKFNAEKRKAAAAIATKAEEAAAAVDLEEEGSGWEDEDEEGEEEWSDEHSDPQPKKSKSKSSSKLQERRGSSRSRGSGQSTSNLDLNALLQRSNRKYSTPPATSPRDPPRAPAPTPLKRMSKKERLRAAEERAKIEAELEAQRKREMFAKKQIFGGRPGEGLLSGMFKRGGSMVNLTEAVETSSPPLRPSPTHGHLPSLSKSPVGPSLLMRSKSAAAMPIETGVSVTRISPQKSKLSEEIASHTSHESGHSNGSGRGSGSPSKDTSLHAQGPKKSSGGSAELKPPSGVDLESSDEGSADEDDYLATSAIHRKISELAAKRDARSQPTPPPQDVPHGQLPLQLDDNGVVQPLSPTTRRRAIIMREMSESLRRNLIIEREKSSTSRAGLQPPGRSNSLGQQPTHARPPPSTHTSILPARGSSGNLAALGQASSRPHAGGHERQDLQRQRSEPSIHEHSGRTSPNYSAAPSPSPDSAPTGEVSRRQAHFAPLPELTRRRTQPTVLGGGFLRPLTRVESPPIINRTQSSANLQGSIGNSPHSPSMMEAPAMQRSSTDGPMRGSSEWDAREQARRRELQMRSRTGDTSYRSHGW